jgi:hypothetical protein
MSRLDTQLDVPGSAPCSTRKLSACCPRCKIPLIGDFEKPGEQPDNVRCPKCSYSLKPPAADTIDLPVLCPICHSMMKAARRAVTLEIDHTWCPACEANLKYETRH